MVNKLCPCCGRRCYMDELKCERGREYAATGVIPPRKPRPDGHGHHGAPSDKPSPRQLYMKLDREEKLVANIKDMAAIIDRLAGADRAPTAAEMFSTIREEDRQAMLMFLEKIKHSWNHAYNSPEHK